MPIAPTRLRVLGAVVLGAVVLGGVLCGAGCGGRSALRRGAGQGGATTTSTGTTSAGAGGGGGSGGEGASCSDQSLGTDADGAQFLALADGAAIWTTSAGAIMRAALDGSAPPELLYGAPASAFAVAVDAGTVYWTEPTRVLRAHLPGGAPEVLADGEAQPFFVAARGEEVWWVDYGAGIFAGSIRHRRADGVLETLVSLIDAPRFMRIDATHAYFTAEALQIPGSSLYGVLARVPLAGGAVEPLSIGLHQPSALALWGADVWWLEQLGSSLELAGSLYVAAKEGGSPALVAQIPNRLALGLAVDDSGAYVTSYASTPDAALHRVPLAGGAPVERAHFSGAALYGDVALTSDAVVWTANWNAGAVPVGTPSVRKLCK